MGRVLVPALAGLLLADLAGAAEEEKRTEIVPIARVEARQALLAVRVLAKVREIEAVEAHALSIHDTEERLRLAWKVVEMLDRGDDVRFDPMTFDAGDGTTLACVSLRHASARDGMRLLMSQIGIRAVGMVQELEAVLVRDSPEQVGKALQLLADFDRRAP
jgi:hypothetical protein